MPIGLWPRRLVWSVFNRVGGWGRPTSYSIVRTLARCYGPTVMVAIAMLIDCRNDDILSRRARGPHLVGLDTGDVPLNTGALYSRKARLRLDHRQGWVWLDCCNVLPLRQHLDQTLIARREDRVHDEVGLVRSALLVKESDKRSLRALGLGPQRVIDEPALIVPVTNSPRLA